MNKPAFKLLKFPEQKPANVDAPETRLQASNSLQCAQTTLNLLIKELSKSGALNDDTVLRLINDTKMNLYVVKDYLTEEK